MATSRIIGFFDERTDAERARSELVSSGVDSSSIDILSSSEDAKLMTSAEVTRKDESLSFGERVKRFFTDFGDWDVPPEHADYYAEGIRRGGYTLSVLADESQLDRVAEILNRCGAVDIDRRAQFYRETGFQTYDMNAQPYSPKESESFRNQYASWEKDRFADNKEEVIPVIQEDVKIGKRAVEKGRVRIYTRVTETPVDKDIRLREEHVDVQRTPVDRPVQTSDMAAFKEGAIELKETVEEAVVDKEARVIEEVHVKKAAEERTETVHETARRTDVEIDRSGKSDETRP